MKQHFCQLKILLCLLLGSVWQVVTIVCKEHAAFIFVWIWSSVFLWNTVITRLYGVITHSVTALPWKLQILFWITQPVSFFFVMWQAGLYCDCAFSLFTCMVEVWWQMPTSFRIIISTSHGISFHDLSMEAFSFPSVYIWSCTSSSCLECWY